MQNWKLATISVTTGILLVILYRLELKPQPHVTTSYQALNRTTRLSISALPLDRRLVDLNDFTFLTDHHCNGTSPYLIVLVHSAPANTYNREEIRRTWGRDVRVLFLLGESDLNLDEEERRNGDLIRGSFTDSYRNLTYKHVMGLKWISSKCAGAKYVLKIDDDVFVDTKALYNWLGTMFPHGVKNLLACQVERNAIVKRSFRSKWRVTPDEYSARYYPDYCLGWVILYSPDVVLQLYAQSTKASYFWIDDVLVTGILAERANLTHLHLGNNALSDETTVSKIVTGRLDQPFIFLLTSPDMFDLLTQFVRLRSS